MKYDYFGTEVNIGDQVAFYRPGYREFVTGTVIKFTPQKIRVEYPSSYGQGSMDTYTEHSTNFIKKP